MAVSVIRTRSARLPVHQPEGLLHVNINYNSPGLTSTHCYVGVLPANALPLETIVRINTAFDQGIVVGTTASASGYVAAADLAEGTTGTTIVDRCASVALSTVDTPVHVRTSTVATAGDADIWIRYLARVG